VVVRLAGALARIERDGERVVCGGGASLAAVVKRATGWGLSGIEFGCAIPGTAGGAVRMNAGAYGGELRDVLDEALVVGAAGARRGGPDALGMAYRRSNVGRGEVVAEVALRLRPGDPEAIRATVAEMQRRRREAQPAKVRTFGSVWKNPDGEMSAGRMLEACGLKGFAAGGARISPVHANFIENTGGARSADVLALMREARRRAHDRFGVELEHEVQMLGPIRL
jgi:UDP-N-acetylmuramate dehydrogenase